MRAAAVPSSHFGPPIVSNTRGFTLVELVAVLVIAAILAVAVLVVINPREFDAARFANEALAQIRYAQKVAVAARRNVTVGIAGNTISLTMCKDAACGATVDVPSPQGEANFIRTAPSGVTVAGATFGFDALGRTLSGSSHTVTISGTVVRTITVEATTGYVHE
jgi:MSHA pilin protein MshC